MVSIFAVKGLRDVDLLSLTPLKKLNRLHIYGHAKAETAEITFVGGIVPLLQTIGSSLELLDLTFFLYYRLLDSYQILPQLNLANRQRPLRKIFGLAQERNSPLP
jgi:hypothetical protein